MGFSSGVLAFVFAEYSDPNVAKLVSCTKRIDLRINNIYSAGQGKETMDTWIEKDGLRISQQGSESVMSGR